MARLSGAPDGSCTAAKRGRVRRAGVGGGHTSRQEDVELVRDGHASPSEGSCSLTCVKRGDSWGGMARLLGKPTARPTVGLSVYLHQSQYEMAISGVLRDVVPLGVRVILYGLYF